MRSAQVLATMPSIQCRLLIRPSQAAQAIWVEGSGSAARISSSERPICVASSSRISQCALPWPCSWSAITSWAQARMILSRVSQSVQLVATRSLRTELRWRVLRRCWGTKLRARPSPPRGNSACAGRTRRPPHRAAAKPGRPSSSSSVDLKQFLEPADQPPMALGAELAHGRADAEVALGDLGIAEERLARALQRDAAFLDDAAAVGDGEAEPRVLLGEQDRQALLAQPRDQ